MCYSEWAGKERALKGARLALRGADSVSMADAEEANGMEALDCPLVGLFPRRSGIAGKDVCGSTTSS